MKHSLTIYRLLFILGIVLLTLVLVGSYLDGADALSVLVLLSPLSPPHLGLWFVLGGIFLLTVGMVGIIRRCFKNYRNLFTALAVLLIPTLTFATFVVGCTYAFFAPMSPLRSEITEVTVVNNSPLVLSVGVKAITSKDTRIEGAVVLNSDDELVAKTPLDDRAWTEGLALAELPGGSEITLTLGFNTSLPSGDYLVRLTCWHQNHGSSSFTIP